MNSNSVFEQIINYQWQYEIAAEHQKPSPEYEKLLADTRASVAEWKAWREKHPGPTALSQFRVAAKWLSPVVSSLALPMVVAGPWGFALGAMVYFIMKDSIPILEEHRVRKLSLKIKIEGGLKPAG